MSLPDLEEELSRPSALLSEELRRIPGDILVLGAGGKMGPTLARMAARAAATEPSRRVVAVARFSSSGARETLEQHGVATVVCDLLDRQAVDALPDAPNVVYMAGQKFGTEHDASRTWAVNTLLPAAVAERFRGARLVAFSTGNVYPLSPVSGEGPTEQDPVGPVGEYAWSALARERVLEFFSRRHGTRMVLLRLNYAVEPRYGVLRDIAERVRAGQPVNVTMGWVNLIWQRDANEIALRALGHCEAPPRIINLTGHPKHAVRWLAQQFADRWNVPVRFEGQEAPTALLSDARAMIRWFGTPETSLQHMIARVAEWMEEGGAALGKPTHFEMREGIF